jgi:hypothetical protein
MLEDCLEEEEEEQQQLASAEVPIKKQWLVKSTQLLYSLCSSHSQRKSTLRQM